jgi:plastocyanin
MTKRLFIALLVMGIAFGFGLYNLNAVQANNVVSVDDLQPGELIRGETFPAVYYYSADGTRYVFPNQKTYDTWYDNFDDVRWVSDADLTTIQIGGNVTYRPGIKMIKINSDPKTYAVGKGGGLYHVASEDAAVALYGSSWNTQIDDVPDGFFGNYTRTEEEITSADDFDVDAVTSDSPDVDTDKDLIAPVDIEISSSGYSDFEVTISAGSNVRWHNTAADSHTVTSDDLTWGSGTMAEGVKYIKRFEEPGTYTYFCSYEPSFTGAVIVE